MNEECIHGLGSPAHCVLCNGREKRDKLEAAARRRKFLQLLAAGVITNDTRKTDRAYSYIRTPSADVRSYDRHGMNLEDDQQRFNKRVR